MAEMLQGMPSLTNRLRALSTSILRTGLLPKNFLRVFVAPLAKPGRNGELCTSKRPISLISVKAKLLENVVLNRIPRAVDPLLDGRQYTYRRARGAELHLCELYEFLSDAKRRNEIVYAASLDIESAFNSVPHDRRSL